MSAELATTGHLLSVGEAADYLRVSPKTLETWRARGGGPHFIQLRTRAIRYRVDDLNAFIAQGVRLSTSDPGSSAIQPRSR
jgi:hypothetical protein